MKDNKLIAEFMGYHKVANDEDKRDYLEDCVKYHTSWDWLMPVVETCYHNGAEENEIGDITHAILNCDINYTYKAVLQFINEYNKTNKK